MPDGAVMRPHPWNANPLPPIRYRLVVANRRDPVNQQLVAVSVSRDALSALERELADLDYEFVRFERLDE
jgi:hypothetical protein